MLTGHLTWLAMYFGGPMNEYHFSSFDWLWQGEFLLVDGFFVVA